MTGSSQTQIHLRIWLADLTYTQQTVAADVIPQAIGGIATFAQANLPLYHPIRVFKYPEKLIAAIERDGYPDIIGFSNYIWNHNLSYRFCETVKVSSSSTVTVMGGPNYPIIVEEQDEFLRAYPAIDFYVPKEGEVAFCELVQAIAETHGDLDAVRSGGIKSVHFIHGNSAITNTEAALRLRDLSVVPSPYTTGLMDEFFDGVLMPIIQTNRGCPFSCTFCVEGTRYYNKVHRNTSQKIHEELDYIGRRMSEVRESGGRNDLFIADSNFGMYREDMETCHRLAETRAEYGWPEYINVATGKNQKERVLEASRVIDGALRLSGSVQSLDPDVLANIKRSNISADGLMDLALSASEVGANSYSEVILALPGDSREKHYRTVQTVIEAGFTNIYLFQLMLLPGTEMATLEARRRYAMDIRYRVLPRCYGSFTLSNQDIVAAEIEEICVGNDTLSFDEYLECRRMHLIVTIFYNDSVFLSLLKLIRVLQLSPWRWIEFLLVETDAPTDLSDLFRSFREATVAELWEDKDDLLRFVRKPGVVDKLISGEIGNNLLFVHKTRAITEYALSLATIVKNATTRLLEHHNLASAETRAFVREAALYHQLRMTNLFTDQDETPQGDFTYDIQSFLNDPEPTKITDYLFESPQRVGFVLEADQRDVIERFLQIYGDTPVGIGRILSKVHTKQLMRRSSLDIKTHHTLTPLSVQISGLQN